MIELLRRCLRFAIAVARYAGRRAVGATLFVALGAVLEGVGVVLLVPLLATLFDTGAGGKLAGLADQFTPGLDPVGRLSLILALFAAVMSVRAVVLWRRDTLLGRLQVGFVEEQRVRIARRLAETRWQTLAGLGHGRVTHIMSGDVQRCGAGVHFLLQGGVAIVMVVVQGGVAVILAPVLAPLAIGLMLIGGLVLSRLLQRSADVGKQVTEANLALMTALGRFLGGMKLAMSQNLQAAFVSGFEHDLAVAADRQTAFIAQQALLRGLWGLLAACVAGATVLAGYGLLHLPAPVLLALLVVLARMSAPASQIQLGLQQIAYSLPAWEAVSALDRDLTSTAAPLPRPAAGAARLEGPVTLRDVVYRHNDAAGARLLGVAGLTLDLEPGEIVGVAGASGAGKTTFADLLAGLVTPQSGRIAVGGAPLTDETVTQWREQVAYVAQDPVLFNDTIRRNLLWANPAATEVAIDAALAIAGADRVVQRLAAGLDTVVGENGSLISGGERQRLALARALLRDPSILILDEATSAIDIVGEHDLLVRLRALASRPMIVLIAHRAESLALCDRILTLADGRLAEEQRLGESSAASRRKEALA